MEVLLGLIIIGATLRGIAAYAADTVYAKHGSEHPRYKLARQRMADRRARAQARAAQATQPRREPRTKAGKWLRTVVDDSFELALDTHVRRHNVRMARRRGELPPGAFRSFVRSLTDRGWAKWDDAWTRAAAKHGVRRPDRTSNTPDRTPDTPDTAPPKIEMPAGRPQLRLVAGSGLGRGKSEPEAKPAPKPEPKPAPKPEPKPEPAQRSEQKPQHWRQQCDKCLRWLAWYPSKAAAERAVAEHKRTCTGHQKPDNQPTDPKANGKPSATPPNNGNGGKNGMATSAMAAAGEATSLQRAIVFVDSARSTANGGKSAQDTAGGEFAAAVDRLTKLYASVAHQCENAEAGMTASDVGQGITIPIQNAREHFQQAEQRVKAAVEAAKAEIAAANDQLTQAEKALNEARTKLAAAQNAREAYQAAPDAGNKAWLLGS